MYYFMLPNILDRTWERIVFVKLLKMQSIFVTRIPSCSGIVLLFVEKLVLLWKKQCNCFLRSSCYAMKQLPALPTHRSAKYPFPHWGRHKGRWCSFSSHHQDCRADLEKDAASQSGETLKLLKAEMGNEKEIRRNLFFSESWHLLNTSLFRAGDNRMNRVLREGCSILRSCPLASL